MAVRIIKATEPMAVKQICCLIYGQPSSRKTSMAQTAHNPITLAFDEGIYRAYGRKTCVLFDSWNEMLSVDLSKYDTPVIDTVGRCLSLLGQSLIADNPKNGNRQGGLSWVGFGALKEVFRQWVERHKASGRDLVFIAQEKESRAGDDPYYAPDIVGGSYTTLMENCDIVGYMRITDGRRVIEWEPSDCWMAKSPPCGWSQMPLPDFGNEPDFLQRLLREAKESMGKVSAASAELAQKEDQFELQLREMALPELNAYLPTVAQLKGAEKRRVWNAIKRHAAEARWTFDEINKVFTTT